MSREIKGILVSRLVILISIILVPIIIFLIFNLIDFQLWFSNDPELNFWLIKILCPLVYSVSWLFFLIIFANRFSNTIENMDRIAGIIPLRMKMFYGINALFILFIFVFPIVTPIISVLSFASFAWHLTTFRKEDWDEEKTSFLTKFFMVLFAIPPIFCTVLILPQFLDLPIFLWTNIWYPLLDYIFIFSYCVCTALAIGSLFILIANSGVSEYEQIYSEGRQGISMVNIKIFELALFIFLFVLALYDFVIINLFYYAGFIIVLVVSIVNHFTGKRRTRKFRGHVFGYVLAAIFMSSSLFSWANLELSEIMGFWFLILLSSVFIILFFYTFIRLDEPEY